MKLVYLLSSFSLKIICIGFVWFSSIFDFLGLGLVQSPTGFKFSLFDLSLVQFKATKDIIRS